jgi:hypothetical protein
MNPVKSILDALNADPNVSPQFKKSVERLTRTPMHPNDQMLAENKRMRAALMECEAYFDNRADVRDGSHGVPEPNEEMSLLQEVREALGER